MLLTLMAAAAATVAVPALAGAAGLDGLRWTSRALVVFAPDGSDPRLARQRQVLAAAPAGVRERDLVLVEAVGRDPGAEALRRRFRVAPGAFRAVLVGKDGGAKLESAAPIEASTLFETVDAMPMRRREMKAAGR